MTYALIAIGVYSTAYLAGELALAIIRHRKRHT